MTHIFDIIYLVTHYGYLGIFIIVFLESGIFFPLPGDSLIFTAGLLATRLGYNIVFLTLLVFVAAFLGGVAGYFIGTKLDFLYNYSFFRKILKKKYTAEAHAFLEKHGLSALLLSRFVPVVRTFLPIVAGMVKMKYSHFIKYNLLGSFVWSAVFVLGGYFLGQSFPQLQEYLLYVVILIVLVSLLPGVFHLAKRKKS
ncbi:MAG: VTT domain-containing protein [Patescibacteria group bacterium]|nr:VTT domain-containing protein [Patescibacteria group bacterium]